MKYILPLLSLLLASPALSETTLNGEDFDAYTKGKTLYYGSGGQPYGVERYLDNQRVVWSFLDGNCKYGHWYEDTGQICFVYEDRPDPQCWTFTQNANGLSARFENDPNGVELYEAQDTKDKMLCYGPDVGV